MPQQPNLIALPTHLGLQFYEKTNVLLFRNRCDEGFDKPCWEAMLTNHETIRLSNQLTAEKIIKSLSNPSFFQINQSCILNLDFLSEITYKTRQCRLISSNELFNLTISRSQLIKLREIYEIK